MIKMLKKRRWQYFKGEDFTPLPTRYSSFYVLFSFLRKYGFYLLVFVSNFKSINHLSFLWGKEKHYWCKYFYLITSLCIVKYTSESKWESLLITFLLVFRVFKDCAYWYKYFNFLKRVLLSFSTLNSKKETELSPTTIFTLYNRKTCSFFFLVTYRRRIILASKNFNRSI